MTIYSTQLRTHAQTLGLTNIGWCAIPTSTTFQTRFAEWLAQERYGDMIWMARNAARRLDPQQIVTSARTIISVSYNYYTPHAHSSDPRRGRISRYAWGDDYHEVLLPKLRALLNFLGACDANATGIAYVDTGPVLEKPWAAQAGLGWQGKHTNLIDQRRGSWFFLGEVITTAMIDDVSQNPPVPLFQSGNLRPPLLHNVPPLKKGDRGILRTDQSLCGTCTKCIDVCPTRAITAPYQLDATRCISYLTIEHKGSIPVELRPLLGNHIYGCDLCQDVCPWNRFATPTPEPAFQPRAENLRPALIELMNMTDDTFRTRFKNSPIKRIKRNRFLRNVAVALGNSKDRAALPALHRAHEDPDPLIREHVAWAIAEIERVEAMP